VDTAFLIEEIKSRISAGSSAEVPAARPKRAVTNRSSSFSGGFLETSCPGSIWTSYGTPFQGCSYPSAPLSDVRSQKPPTPPPSKDDATSGTARDLLLTLSPQAAANCGQGLNPEGKRFCGLLQLLSSESNASVSSGKTVPCRVSYELLKCLIDEQDTLSMENAAFVLKDGVRVGEDGCQVDATVLTKVLEKLTSVDNNERMVDV
jgi:hypothetical protein